MLQSKIKSLESQVQRLGAEKESLQAEMSFADRNAAFRGHVAGGEEEKHTVGALERLVADLRQENIKLIEENKKVSCAAGEMSRTHVGARTTTILPSLRR